MRLSPQERRDKLQIYNVAEAAREIGVDQDRLYSDIWAERVVQPSTVFHRRAYFTFDELKILKIHYKEVTQNGKDKDC
ncbi:hypothetical protein N9D23_00570 [Rubripirellula sp.]|nr:hypothetical protein [Rubripirellula sp.]